MYSWGGEFQLGNPDSCIAVVTLSDELAFDKEKVAIWGSDKTENLGIEKVVANILSNPNIRYLLVCGHEVRGHRAGDTIVALHQNGMDDNSKVIGAKGAVPYVENLPQEAVERFQQQVELVDMIDEVDAAMLAAKVDELAGSNPGPFDGGTPMHVEVAQKGGAGMGGATGAMNLHKDLIMDEYLETGSREEGGG